MKNFLAWLGGIAASVIAGVLVYYYTVPTPGIQFEGMVIDAKQEIPVRNAEVSFQIEGTGASELFHDFTDDNGSYGINLAGLSKSSTVLLRFHAKGYRDESKVFHPLSDDNRHDATLSPVAPSHAPTPQPVHVPPRYIKKLTVPTFHIQQTKKK
jgi:hypothetical protein